MRPRLSVTAALIVLAASVGALAAPKMPTLDVATDAVTVRSSGQALTVNLTDGSLHLETPYGNRDLVVNITSPSGWAHPMQVSAPPKIYRGKDAVAAQMTFPVPNDRKLVLHVSAVPGVDAVFVKSGVTGLFGSSRDYYFWSWKQTCESYFSSGQVRPIKLSADDQVSRFGYNDWVFLPSETGGLAVLTNGIVGYMPDQPFLNALPRWRFLRPGETLDIGFGLAGVSDPNQAAALSKLTRAKPIPALKRFYITKQAKIDYGKPAPDWLRKADMYNGWYRGWSDDKIKDWMTDFPLVVGVPANKALIAKAHAAGFRVIVYINFSELENNEVQMRAKGFPYRQPDDATTADLLDLAKHPDWTCIDSQGNQRRSSYGISQDIPGQFYSCTYQPDLHEAALTRVCNIMNLGADGVFFDNAAAVTECYGPKFGKHTHPGTATNSTEAFEQLQQAIYKLVKTFGEDKIVMQNSGILPSHWAYSDAQMWEGFRFTEGRPGPENEWSELQYAAEEHAEAVRHGKVPVILSYFSSIPADRRREGALYTYAYTRLYGFLMADWFDLTKSPDNQKLAKSIYTVRLGKPLGEVKPAGDALYRVFENGVVVLNPTRTAISISIPTPRAGRLTDVAYDRELVIRGGKLDFEMAPESGRVLVWKG